MKIKLSIMMIAIVVGGVAIIELVRSSNIALALAKDKTMYLA
jgi:hypothetical protein